MIAGHQVDDAMFSYIAQNIDADTCKLLLKAEPQLSFDKSFAITQIDCRRKSINKIPDLLSHVRFLFPKPISAEQCTHQLVAQFHASLFDPDDGVLDMTMGLGVDDYYICQRVKSVTAIEIDNDIAAVGKYNFSFLSTNVEVIHGDSVEYLENLDISKKFDSIFIDPARRSNTGKRLYGLCDCLPDVISLLPLIKKHCTSLFIKASPMLDVAQSVRDLDGGLTDIWAVSIKNECKELFFKLDFKKETSPINLHAINHNGEDWIEFSTNYSPISYQEKHVLITPGSYLYEPNSSIMKLGCYQDVERAFNAYQISKNSHLIVSDKLLSDFPGRQFSVVEVIPFKDKEIKQLQKQIKQANIATRNFRLKADVLRKRLGINEGGDIYIFATTLYTGQQVLILCKKII